MEIYLGAKLNPLDGSGDWSEETAGKKPATKLLEGRDMLGENILRDHFSDTLPRFPLLIVLRVD